MEAAVPPFASDADQAYLELGKLFAYVRQLSETLLERAEVMNGLDDERLEAAHRAEQLGRNLDEERERNQQLMAQNDTLRYELEDLRGELAEARRCRCNE